VNIIFSAIQPKYHIQIVG